MVVCTWKYCRVFDIYLKDTSRWASQRGLLGNQGKVLASICECLPLYEAYFLSLGAFCAWVCLVYCSSLMAAAFSTGRSL